MSETYTIKYDNYTCTDVPEIAYKAFTLLVDKNAELEAKLKEQFETSQEWRIMYEKVLKEIEEIKGSKAHRTRLLNQIEEAHKKEVEGLKNQIRFCAIEFIAEFGASEDSIEDQILWIEREAQKDA